MLVGWRAGGRGDGARRGICGGLAMAMVWGSPGCAVNFVASLTYLEFRMPNIQI